MSKVINISPEHYEAQQRQIEGIDATIALLEREMATYLDGMRKFYLELRTNEGLATLPSESARALTEFAAMVNSELGFLQRQNALMPHGIELLKRLTAESAILTKLTTARSQS